MIYSASMLGLFVCIKLGRLSVLVLKKFQTSFRMLGKCMVLK